MATQFGKSGHEQSGSNEEQSDLIVDQPVELVVVSVQSKSARCRRLDDRSLIFRSADFWKLVPGYIATVMPGKYWRFGGHLYLSGELIDVTLDVDRLGLEPLRLQSWGTWDPAEEYWGEEDEPLEAWAKAIITDGPRPMYEMEQVLPGADPVTFDDDPILHATQLWHAGYRSEAYDLLNKLCETDLRCLDAHSHLGNWSLEYDPNEALRHYEAGMRIGELSLGDDFDGVLPWSLIDNRPFLRCVHGFGLALWRLDRFEEAEAVFQRILRLNPTDNQGVRFNLEAVRARRPWSEEA